MKINPLHQGFLSRVIVLGLWFVIPRPMAAQPAPAPDTAAQVTAFKSELETATDKVKAIINKPVVAYRRTPGMDVGVYSPGWFHEGASKPNFDTVDVRQSQELIYNKHVYVTSDLNPGMVFLGRDLEFNGMTKYFYTNRSLPKKRLTEAEMLEVNRLYRIIGDYQRKIRKIEHPDLLRPPDLESEPESESGSAESSAATSRQPIPKDNYRKAAIGIAAVLGVYVLYRFICALTKKKFGNR